MCPSFRGSTVCGVADFMGNNYSNNEAIANIDNNIKRQFHFPTYDLVR